MLRFGFSTIGCPDYTVEQVIDAARSLGYAGVEIRFLRGTVDLAGLEEFSAARIGETRRRFEDAGVAVVAINTGVRMVSLDAAHRQVQRDAARRQIEMAAALGAPYLRLFGGPIPAGQDRERTLDAIAAGLGEIADESARGGVTSLIETHDDFCRSDSVLDLYRRGASERLGVLWDTLHSYRWGESADEMFGCLGRRIKLVHVKDAVTATRSGFDFALTGEGTVPIASFLDVLEAAGYDGFVDFEWEKGWHPEIPGPEIALPHFARYVASKVRGS
ncbi:sugar phosphate isomerase/epimerase [uncultured Alsobacter sp.]|uniref:sugar phosphate isomerase/epimerase family protein n=1 Tax=uncultured Alsobacter sp. TaxID=1748258 RepID=UPI0025E5C8D0|nr:sugar phosphate isomerase/epimerase family protein [uncultured Alsobacter sp.]